MFSIRGEPARESTALPVRTPECSTNYVKVEGYSVLLLWLPNISNVTCGPRLLGSANDSRVRWELGQPAEMCHGRREKTLHCHGPTGERFKPIGSRSIDLSALPSTGTGSHWWTFVRDSVLYPIPFNQHLIFHFSSSMSLKCSEWRSADPQENPCFPQDLPFLLCPVLVSVPVRLES